MERYSLGLRPTRRSSSSARPTGSSLPQGVPQLWPLRFPCANVFSPFTMLRLVSLKSVLRKATDDTGIALSLLRFLHWRFQLRLFGSPEVAAVPAAALPHVLVFLVDVGGRAARACLPGPEAENLDGKQCLTGPSLRSKRSRSRNLEGGRGPQLPLPSFAIDGEAWLRSPCSFP